MLPVYSKMRFTEYDPNYGDMAAIQRTINAAMRLANRVLIRDRVSIEVLQQNSQIPSINQMAAETTLMECWRALNHDLPSGLHFSLVRTNTRGADQGKLTVVPTKNKESFVWKASKLWNNALPDIALLEEQVKAKDYIKTHASIYNFEY